MSTLVSRVVRSKIDISKPFASTAIIGVGGNQTIETVRGNATRFQFGFFDAAGDIYDLSGVESINLKIQPSQTIDGALADQTVAAVDLDLTTDADSWDDGTKQQVEFSFSNAEMNIDPGSTKKSFWLVVTAIMETSGDEVTLCGGNIVFHNDNNTAAAPPPENPGTAITLEQADARYPQSGAFMPAGLVLDHDPVDGSPGVVQEELIEFMGSAALPTVESDISFGWTEGGVPKSVNITPTAVFPTTAAEFAIMVSDEMEADPDFNAFLTVSPSGGSVKATVRTAAANDPTMRFTVTTLSTGFSYDYTPGYSVGSAPVDDGDVATAVGQPAVVNGTGLFFALSIDPATVWSAQIN